MKILHSSSILLTLVLIISFKDTYGSKDLKPIYIKGHDYSSTPIKDNETPKYTYGSKDTVPPKPVVHIKEHGSSSTPVKDHETPRALAATSRATTYSSLLTVNVSNTIMVALAAAAGALYYTGFPIFSIRRSLTGLWDRWDRWDEGLSSWQDSLIPLWNSGLGDAVEALTPVVQEAIRLYMERNS